MERFNSTAGTYNRIHRDSVDVNVGGNFTEVGKTTNHSTFLTKIRSGGNSETRQSWFETEYSEDTRVNMVPGDGYGFSYIGSGAGSKTWDDYGFQHTYSINIEEGADGANVAWAHTTEYAHFTNGVADPANQGRHTESGGGNVFDYNYKLTERDQISGTVTSYYGNDHTTITRDRDVTTVTKGDNKDNNYSAKMTGHDNTDRVTWKPDEDIWEYSHLVYDSLHTRTRRTGGSGGEGTTWGPGPGSSRTETTPTHVDTWASNNSSTGRVWGIKYINYSSGSGSSNPRAGSASAWGDTAPHTSYFEAYGGKSTTSPPVPENPNWKFGQGNTGLSLLINPNLPGTNKYVGSEMGSFSGVGSVTPGLLDSSASTQPLIATPETAIAHDQVTSSSSGYASPSSPPPRPERVEPKLSAFAGRGLAYSWLGGDAGKAEREMRETGLKNGQDMVKWGASWTPVLSFVQGLYQLEEGTDIFGNEISSLERGLSVLDVVPIGVIVSPIKGAASKAIKKATDVIAPVVNKVSDAFKSCDSVIGRWFGNCFVAGTKVHVAAVPDSAAVELVSSVIGGDAFSIVESYDIQPLEMSQISIEEVELGSRIDAENPLSWEVEDIPEIVRSQWRQIDMWILRDDGTRVDFRVRHIGVRPCFRFSESTPVIEGRLLSPPYRGVVRFASQLQSSNSGSCSSAK